MVLGYKGHYSVVLLPFSLYLQRLLLLLVDLLLLLSACLSLPLSSPFPLMLTIALLGGVLP